MGKAGLHAALLRPLLKYGIQFWRPVNKGELAALEGVQRRATRMIKVVRERTVREACRGLPGHFRLGEDFY